MVIFSPQNGAIKKFLLGKLILLLMFLIIIFTPRDFTLRTVELRPEDFSLLIGSFYISYYFIINKIVLDGLILRWILLNLIGWMSGLLTFNLMLSDISLVLFFVKFLLPLVFYIIVRDNKANHVNEKKLYILILSLIVIYQFIRILLFNDIALYGYSAKGYEQSPLSAGFYYILLQIILFYIRDRFDPFKNIYNFIYLILNLSIFILVVLTGSKVSIILSIFLIFAFFMEIKDLNKIQATLIVVIFSFLLLPFIIMLISNEKIIVVNSSIGRLLAFNYPIEVLIGRGNWYKLDWLTGFESIMGGGFLLGHISSNLQITFGMHYDNELIFRYVTSGFIGLFLIFEFFFYIYNKIKEKQDYSMLIILFGFVAASMGAEILNLSLSSCIFFIFLGILFSDDKCSNEIKL